MSKALHDKLIREGKKRGLKGKALDDYVFGTLHDVEGRKARKARKKK